MIELISEFCEQENLCFVEKYKYDNDIYFNCPAIRTLQPMQVIAKLVEYLIEHDVLGVSKRLGLLDYKFDGIDSYLLFLTLSENFEDNVA